MESIISAQDQEKEQNLVDKIPKLKLIVGGKDGDPPNDNWLIGIPTGTVFLARHNDTVYKNPVLECFQLEWKSEDSLWAYVVANQHMMGKDEKKVTMYVDCLRFCRQYKLVHTLGRVEQ